MDQAKLEVGLNYPWAWNAYGTYFGAGAPPGSVPVLDAWTDLLDGHLAYLKQRLGIRRVRIFLLCNAFNYGSTSSCCVPSRSPSSWTPPSHLSQKFLDHLERMLRCFQRHQMQVLPSLIDFGAFLAYNQRWTLATVRQYRDVFFATVLRPFLRCAEPYRDQIFAWELMNEPVWASSRALFSQPGGGKVPNVHMRAFLRDGLSIIEEFGFPSTVGHRFLDDMLATDTRGTIPQFHFYGWSLPKIPGVCAGVDPCHLPYASHLPKGTFVGEFAARHPKRLAHLFRDDGQGLAWRGLKGLDTCDTRTRVCERLKLLHQHGFRLAFLWPDLEGAVPNALSDPLKLSFEAQEGIRDYQYWSSQIT